MKIYFFNLGNSSISGGFSAYSKFISETNLNEFMIKFSDFGTQDRNSVNIFFQTVGLERHGSFSRCLHKINQVTYTVVFIYLLMVCLWSRSKVWVQSSYLSRSNILRFIALNIAKEDSLIIDVRDREFFPFIEKFAKYKFISCGAEIKKQISMFSGQVFNLSTPFSREDIEYINLVKNGNYLVYAHGIQKDKSPEQLLRFLNIIDKKNYVVILCGRIRTHSKTLVDEILGHKKIKYVGNIDKIVMLALLKNSSGILVTGENEGVPRILEEAKNFSIPIISSKPQEYLTNYRKKFTFEEFANKISNEGHKKNKYKNYREIQEKLVEFIFED